jgi:hypothetical protein
MSKQIGYAHTHGGISSNIYLVYTNIIFISLSASLSLPLLHIKYRSYNTNQVGGYATIYDTPNEFTFITVRGGRHEVPETQPVRALQMFENFITKTNF